MRTLRRVRAYACGAAFRFFRLKPAPDTVQQAEVKEDYDAGIRAVNRLLGLKHDYD